MNTDRWSLPRPRDCESRIELKCVGLRPRWCGFAWVAVCGRVGARLIVWSVVCVVGGGKRRMRCLIGTGVCMMLGMLGIR